MDDGKLKGKAENIKGRMKEAIGNITGHKKMEAEGTAERAKGAAKEKVAEVKEEVEEEEELDIESGERRED